MDRGVKIADALGVQGVEVDSLREERGDHGQGGEGGGGKGSAHTHTQSHAALLSARAHCSACAFASLPSSLLPLVCRAHRHAHATPCCYPRLYIVTLPEPLHNSKFVPVSVG